MQLIRGEVMRIELWRYLVPLILSTLPMILLIAARAAQIAGEAEVTVIVAGYTHLGEGEYVSPGTMAELSKNGPPPTPEEMPIAQAMMEKMSATNSMILKPFGN